MQKSGLSFFSSEPSFFSCLQTQSHPLLGFWVSVLTHGLLLFGRTCLCGTKHSAAAKNESLQHLDSTSMLCLSFCLAWIRMTYLLLFSPQAVRLKPEYFCICHCVETFFSFCLCVETYFSFCHCFEAYFSMSLS